MLLNSAFFERTHVTQIAKELLGCTLFTKIDNQVTGGIIVETEAYSYKERGCHAYNMKRTARTQVMFGKPGTLYVYHCYGMYSLVNIVTNKEEVPEAVLIRAIEPTEGLNIMQTRCAKIKANKLTAGPGKLTRALGITRKLNGIELPSDLIWIEKEEKIPKAAVVSTTRIGIDYAGDDAQLPWRFYLRENLWVSKK
ncbi:MAG: DNA-3-methyladenine glycosylase [Chryseotalea sp.]|jgi:DNA-3-methyladenine glycosylase